MTLRDIEKDTTLAVQCYDQIEKSIVDGTLAPGQKLKMKDLKKTLSTGQSPIREALSRLVASGLVEVKDNKGFRVSRISESDVRDTYKTFLQIEMLALNQAMELGDDAWEGSIVGALYQLAVIENKKEPVAYSVWAERNYAFHVALIAGCKSPLLMQLRADVYRRFDRYCRIAFTMSHTALDLNHEEHKKLAEAVLQKNKKTVAECITYHIMGALEGVISVLKKNKLL